MLSDIEEIRMMMDMDPGFTPFDESELEEESDIQIRESDRIFLPAAIEILDTDRNEVVLAARKANRFSVKYPAASKKLMDLISLQTRALISQVILSEDSEADLVNVNALLDKLHLEASWHIRKCHKAAVCSRGIDTQVFTRVLDLETEWVRMLARLESSKRKVNDPQWRVKARSFSIRKDTAESFGAIEAEKAVQPLPGISGFGSFTALPAFRPLHQDNGQDDTASPHSQERHVSRDKSLEEKKQRQERKDAIDDPDFPEDFFDDDLFGYLPYTKEEIIRMRDNWVPSEAYKKYREESEARSAERSKRTDELIELLRKNPRLGPPPG